MKPKKVPAQKKKTSQKRKKKKRSFPIVAIGASAGGLEAVSRLLKDLPSDTGMAFFYIQHLSPDHPSNLSTLLSKPAQMKVQEAKNLMVVAPNNLYVCTPNKEMSLVGGKIKLVPRNASTLPYLPIDDFFTSLAKEYKEKVIGIVLSGKATDGTKGLKAIKEAGGVTFAQDNSAKYAGMPKSAIEETIVDFVLSPEKIARELIAIGKNGPLMQNPITDNARALKTIFEILHKRKGADFSHYKIATFKRRLNYRMLHCGAKTIKDYIKLLQEKADETENLCKDLLINVTSFFRDKETFRYLKTTFLPKLLSIKRPDETLRIWVPGCSTGEEAYSIAILINELQSDKAKKIPVQIFATDLSEAAIKDARIGEYSQKEVEQIAPELVKRYFIKTGDTYRIIKELREICVFAPHNILRDPPFSRIDFISCCNLLIYFDTTAQNKSLALMNFALNDGGYLMLGKSESVGTSSQFFTQPNHKYKIYSRKKKIGTRKIPELTPHFPRILAQAKNEKSISRKNAIVDSRILDGAIDSVLLSHYMPACAIINKDMEILKFRGTTSMFLSHSSGNASLNILKMTRPEFSIELRGIIQRAFKEKQTIKKTGIEIKVGSSFRSMSLEASPLKSDWDEPLLLIVFSLQEQAERNAEKEISHKAVSSLKDRRIKKLTEELNTNREEMRSIIEGQEAAYEELQAANEEIVSTNEEFQTLNEELETTKEEIEATNEELISTNQELQMRNDLLTESYRYSEAIIATIHEPMLILDNSLHVKSANKSFYRKFLVTKEETEGMSLYELGNKQWNIPALRDLLNDIVSQNTNFKNLEITHEFQGIGEKIMLLNAHRIIQKTHGENLILLAIEDITERALHYLKEKEVLHKDIRIHKADKMELEKAVKRRTRQLRQKNAELEDANKDLTSFTYISSHDLQEPLRKIKNYVSVLLEEEAKVLSSNGKKYLQSTYEVANRMQMLIEDLLIYSRSKNAERKFEKTDLNIILDEVRKDFEDIIHKKKAIIRVGNLCEINIIRFQFRQLIHNLMGNSLKFSKPRVPPSITIRSKVVHGSKLHIEKLSSKTNYCHLIYTDNGIGFDPQYNERIFEVFQRLHSVEEYSGTGMGLAICKRIVENHNGVITAMGKLKKGARFDIYIPFLEQS